MKKRIAIITLTKDFNYGNRLQNYALQQLIHKLGFSSETLFNENWSLYLSPSNLYYNIKKVLKRILFLRIHEMRVARKFDDFNKKYISWGASINFNSNMSNISKEYDYVITGSDQVWNPFWGFITEKEFLTWAEKEKSIAYAASFGVDNIPNDKVELYRKWLKGIRHISVREQKAAKIIEELINRDVPVVVDPTMCISREQWVKIEKKSKAIKKENYILIYMLGSLSDDAIEKIERYGTERELSVVYLIDFQVNGHTIGPMEFLGLVHNANIIVTDSFHGAVFSIIYNKKFLCVKRVGQTDEEQMNSRIITLLDKFDLMKLYTNQIELSLEEINIDWDDVNLRLKSEQDKAIKYLKKSLELI